MTIEITKWEYPGAESPEAATCRGELRRNRLTQPLSQQKFWIALCGVMPELTVKLSEAYIAQMNVAIAHAEDETKPAPDPGAMITLSPQETLYLETYPLAMNFCRFASLVKYVFDDTTPELGKMTWKPTADSNLLFLFDWFVSDPERYDYLNHVVDGVFRPNGLELAQIQQITQDEITADPNS